MSKILLEITLFLVIFIISLFIFMRKNDNIRHYFAVKKAKYLLKINSVEFWNSILYFNFYESIYDSRQPIFLIFYYLKQNTGNIFSK